MEKTWTGAWDAFKRSWQLIKENPGFPLLFLGLNLIAGIVDSRDTDDLTGWFLVVALITAVAMAKYALMLSEGKKVSWSASFSTSPGEYLRVLFGYIIGFILIALSAVLLLVPLVWMIPWTAFMVYVILEKGVGPIEGFRQSKALASNRKGEVWKLIGITILFNIPIGILGSFGSASMVVSNTASALVSLVCAVCVASLYQYVKTSPAVVPAPVPEVAKA